MAELGTATGAAEEQTGADQEIEAAAEGTETREEETGEETAAGAEEGHEAKPGAEKTPSGVQRKIDKEVGRRKRAEEDAAYWRGRAEALEQVTGKGGQTEAGKPATGDDAAVKAEFAKQHPKPTEDQFRAEGRTTEEAWEMYQEALTDWKIDQREYVKSQKDTSATKNREAEQARTRISEQKEKGETEFEDFAEVAGSVQMTPAMLETLYHSEIGHRMAYFLGQNPKEAERIANLSPFLQVKELGRIEQKIESGAVQLKKPVSKAPAPAPRPGAKGAVPDDEEKRYTDPNTSTEERIRLSQERKQRERQGK